MIPFRYSVRMRIMGVCLAAAALACAQEPASVFQNVCAKCHPPEAVVTPRSRAEWLETVNKMVDLGAKVSAEERTILLDYLSATYAPGAAGGRRGRGGPRGRGGGPTPHGAPPHPHRGHPHAAHPGPNVWGADCNE